MAETKDDIKGRYPLPAYNYRVEIGSTTLAFSEVSGLSIAHEVTTYKESPVEGGAPGPRTLLMPAQRTPPTLTLKRGVVPGARVRELYAWVSSKQANLIEKRDVFIRLCDENGEAVISWKASNAFPTKLDAPAFSAGSNDAAVESMELKADEVSVEVA
jgi:phage tail-like protein